MTRIVDVQDLHKQYRPLRGGPTVALDGVDFNVDGPGVFGLLGPNGSGKTTLIRCLLGLVAPTRGSVQLFETPVSELGTVATRIGALVEGPKFAPTISARDNLEHLAALGDVARARVHEVLELVELSDRAGQNVETFSLGMAQRLGIAAALLRDPDLVILDEPTNGLDPAGIADVRRLVRRLADEGRSVLLSSHQLHEVQQVCDHLTVLRRGRVVASGTIGDLIGNHATQRVVVRIDDRDSALTVLIREGLAAMPGLDTDTILVQLGDGANAADVNRLLAHDGLYAHDIHADAVSLEDAFLSITGEPTTHPGRLEITKARQ